MFGDLFQPPYYFNPFRKDLTKKQRRVALQRLVLIAGVVAMVFNPPYWWLYALMTVVVVGGLQFMLQPAKVVLAPMKLQQPKQAKQRSPVQRLDNDFGTYNRKQPLAPLDLGEQHCRRNALVGLPLRAV